VGSPAGLRQAARRRVAFALVAATAWLAPAATARAVAPGDIVVADFPAAPAPSGLVRFNPAGNLIGPFTSVPIQAPRDLAFDAAGNLYVADNAAVLIFDGDGNSLGSLTLGLTKAMALAFDAAGDLFVSNRINGGTSEILRYAPGGALLDTWAIPEFDNGGPEPFAREIAFAPGGLLYLALRGSNSSSNDNLLASFDPQTGVFVAFADSADQVTQPIGLAFESGGALLVVNDTGTQTSQASRIVQLDAAGNFVAEFWSEGAVRDLTFDGFDQLHGANRLGDVTLWNPNGSFRKAYGAAGLIAPISVALIPAPAPLCQNEIVEAGEDCDDGNTDPCDGCTATCTFEFGCGDGSVCGVEECDDGNTLACDGCSLECAIERCGDGVLCGFPPLDESCDDGNTDPCDGCSPGCTPEVCGNGILDCGEECDDADTEACDGCSSCRIDERAYLDDFENGSAGWSATGMWNLDDYRSVSPTHAWYYGQTTFRNYQTLIPGPTAGSLTSPTIDVTHHSGVALSFNYYLETENQPGFDVASVEASRDGFASDVVVLASQLADASFTAMDLDLSALTGGLLQVRFAFDTVDDANNHFEGFYVDDVVVRASGPILCGNGFTAAGCGETCDDGNALGGDGCSNTCQLEGVTALAIFSGVAAGGSIALSVSGVAVGVPTTAGDSSADVAAAVAAAINSESSLQGLGVTAVAVLDGLYVLGGAIDGAASSDPGIQVQLAAAVRALGPTGVIALAAVLLLATLTGQRAGW
jgi:cysteine-rich repeat protein